MLRLFITLVCLPVAALLCWLALGTAPRRADFVAATEELRTLDPQRVSWLDEIQVANALFEGLTRPDPQTQLPQPAAAESWDQSPDGREIVFHLRDDAKWSNGEPVVADHFRFAWLRALDPHVEAQYASLLFVIDGAEAYYRSRLNDDPDDDFAAERVGITAVDRATLRVRLAAPCSYFLDLTSFPTLAPVYPPLVERFAYRDGKVLRSTRHLWTRPANIVCNGPFVLQRWDFKRRLLLRRNAHYWDQAAIAVDSIEFLVVADTNAALAAYETGRVDLLRGVEQSLARVLAAETQAGRRRDFHIGDRFATYFFRVNCKRPPLDNADLRKALALAIDKEAICASVLGMGETPADSYVPPGALSLMPRKAADGRTIYYEPPDGLGAGLTREQRLEQAREFLRRSGFDKLAAERPIEIAYPPTPPLHRRIAEVIQDQWQSELNIRVSLRVMERKVLSSRIRSLDYDIVRSDWYGDYLDPSTFLDMYTTESGQNRTGWTNAEYDRLIAAAAREPSNRRRFDLFRRAERILCAEELPIIPLYFKRGNYLLNPRFTGLVDNVRDMLPIHRVRFADPSPRSN